MASSPWTSLSRLEVGDDFGPIATDDEHPGVGLVVVANVDPNLRGAGGGHRNYRDLTDQYGRVWRNGGARSAGDPYGWKRVES